MNTNTSRMTAARPAADGVDTAYLKATRHRVRFWFGLGVLYEIGMIGVLFLFPTLSPLKELNLGVALAIPGALCLLAGWSARRHLQGAGSTVYVHRRTQHGAGIILWLIWAVVALVAVLKFGIVALVLAIIAGGLLATVLAPVGDVAEMEDGMDHFDDAHHNDPFPDPATGEALGCDPISGMMLGCDDLLHCGDGLLSFDD